MSVHEKVVQRRAVVDVMVGLRGGGKESGVGGRAKSSSRGRGRWVARRWLAGEGTRGICRRRYGRSAVSACLVWTAALKGERA